MLAERIKSKGLNSFLGHGSRQESVLSLLKGRTQENLERPRSWDLGSRRQLGMAAWNLGSSGSLTPF